MKNTYIYLITLAIYLIATVSTLAQNIIKGQVLSDNEEALVGATVRILGTDRGAITDLNGSFELQITATDQLVVSYVGYLSDTIVVYGKNNIRIILTEEAEEMAAVIVRSQSTMIDNLQPIQSQIILEAELLKAACCNLSESFETNASVDVSFSDAVTGAKVIRMLGMDGKYVQINRENIPLVRGLSGRFGLGFVPGTWIQSIDVGKGAGSVVNGYESMTGQINLEFKKPDINEKVYFNTYVNDFGRMEVNYNQSIDINEKWSTGLLTHYDYFGNTIDRNNDGFVDLPKSQQINLLNRYKYTSDKVVSQFGIHVMTDDKVGGQNGFGFNDDALTSNLYGYTNRSNKYEVFGKTGLLFPDKPYKGWGFIYSLSYQDIDSNFGRRNYTGKETTAYANVIYQNIIGNSFHQYRTGASFLYDDFQESFNFQDRNRTEIVPGAFFEYTYSSSDKFTAVLGNRVDYHSIFGFFATPRVHFRYQPLEQTTIRWSIGSGRRTPNPIAENVNFLVSSKSVQIDPNLTQEITWNIGSSIVQEALIGERALTLIADYNYISFQNQMIVDLMSNPYEIDIYNLNGKSFAHSAQIEGQIEINSYFDAKVAYKYQDVRATMNNTLQIVPYVPKNRWLINTSFATPYDKWKADLTANFVGIKRLPSIDGHNALNDNFSPNFWLINAQITRGFKWGSIYLGGENLLNFKQTQPIVSSDDPFSIDFDASNIWGPIAGRMIYSGLRYKIK